jgi:transposase
VIGFLLTIRPWVVLELVDRLDLSAFHKRHPNYGVGRRAYDPAMMLAVLLYGYCVGLRSSRKIAQACREDLAFKVICADVPGEP